MSLKLMNRTITLLMFSDLFVITGFGVIDPILAIFIKENLVGGTIFAAGLASMLFLLTKSIIQLPFSRYVDKQHHNIAWLIGGTFLIATVPFFYLLSDSILSIYVAQVIHGIGAGLAYPTWLGLWSTHLDKNHESFEWSMYSTFTGIGISATAAIGAAIAQFFGFSYIFIMGGILAMIGCAVLFGLEMEERKKMVPVRQMHYHSRRKLFSIRRFFQF